MKMSKCLLTVHLLYVTISTTVAPETSRQKYGEIMQEVKIEGEEKVKRTLNQAERNEETEWRCETKASVVNQTS